MSMITVGPNTATLIEDGFDVLDAKAYGQALIPHRARSIPAWNPDGTDVCSVKEAAAVMLLPEDVVAHYIIESKDAGALLEDALNHIELKVIRHVRTPAGVKRFNQPIGSVIVRDGESPLQNLTSVKPVFDGAETVNGADGNQYHIAEDPDEPGKYWALPEDGDWDKAVASGKEEAVYKALDKQAAGKGAAKKPSLRDEIANNAPTSIPTTKKPAAKVAPDAARGNKIVRDGEVLDGSWSDYLAGKDIDAVDAYLNTPAGKKEPAALRNAVKKIKATRDATAGMAVAIQKIQDGQISQEDRDLMIIANNAMGTRATSAAEELEKRGYERQSNRSWQKAPDKAPKSNPDKVKVSTDANGIALKPEGVQPAKDSKPDKQHHKIEGDGKTVNVSKVNGKWATNEMDGRAGSASGLRQSVRWHDSEENAVAYANKRTGNKPAPELSPEGVAAVAKMKSDVTAASLKNTKPGDKVTMTWPGKNGVNNTIFTKGTDGRWHRGTADVKGWDEKEMLDAFNGVTTEPKVFQHGEKTGSGSTGPMLPGGKDQGNAGRPVGAATPKKTGNELVAEGWDQEGEWENYFANLTTPELTSVINTLKRSDPDDLLDDAMNAAVTRLDMSKRPKAVPVPLNYDTRETASGVTIRENGKVVARYDKNKKVVDLVGDLAIFNDSTRYSDIYDPADVMDIVKNRRERITQMDEDGEKVERSDGKQRDVPAAVAKPASTPAPVSAPRRGRGGEANMPSTAPTTPQVSPLVKGTSTLALIKKIGKNATRGGIPQLETVHEDNEGVLWATDRFRLTRIAPGDSDYDAVKAYKDTLPESDFQFPNLDSVWKGAEDSTTPVDFNSLERVEVPGKKPSDKPYVNYFIPGTGVGINERMLSEWPKGTTFSYNKGNDQKPLLAWNKNGELIGAQMGVRRLDDPEEIKKREARAAQNAKFEQERRDREASYAQEEVDRKAKREAEANLLFGRLVTSSMTPAAKGRLRAHLERRVNWEGKVKTNAEIYAESRWTSRKKASVGGARGGVSEEYLITEDNGISISVPKMVFEAMPYLEDRTKGATPTVVPNTPAVVETAAPVVDPKRDEQRFFNAVMRDDSINMWGPTRADLQERQSFAQKFIEQGNITQLRKARRSLEQVRKNKRSLPGERARAYVAMQKIDAELRKRSAGN